MYLEGNPDGGLATCYVASGLAVVGDARIIDLRQVVALQPVKVTAHDTHSTNVLERGSATTSAFDVS